jgi:hypothetical protein
MSIDSDIAAALPEPPPPRPARRDAAIAEALRRFDGGDRQAAAPPAAWRGRVVRPRFAALATIALVALVALPMWMSGDHPLRGVSRESPTSGVPSAIPGAARSPAAPGPIADRSGVPAPPVLAETPPPVTVPPLVPASSPPASPAAAPVDALHADARDGADIASFAAPARQPADEKRLDKDLSGRRENRVALADAAPAPPPPPAVNAPAAPAMAGLAKAEAPEAGIVVTGRRADESSDDVVVTGQLRSAAKPARRGDWNACTVNDPKHRLGACTKLVDPAAPGADGRAAAQIADGLSRAWQDDFDGAIAAFDQAIAISPRLSFAYLNRGLAYAREGESERALADLDQAVRYAPNAARNYYNRGLLWRQRGDSARSDADMARAVALDRRYKALVR